MSDERRAADAPEGEAVLQARLKAARATWNDWRGRCRCGLERQGPLEELRQPCPGCGAS